MNGKVTCGPPAQINLESQSVILRNKDWISHLVAEWLGQASVTESRVDQILTSAMTLQDHTHAFFPPLLMSLTIIPPWLQAAVVGVSS